MRYLQIKQKKHTNMRKLQTLFLALLGEITKLACQMGVLRPRHGVNNTEKRKHRVVVSLTSYRTGVFSDI